MVDGGLTYLGLVAMLWFQDFFPVSKASWIIHLAKIGACRKSVE